MLWSLKIQCLVTVVLRVLLWCSVDCEVSDFCEPEVPDVVRVLLDGPRSPRCQSWVLAISEDWVRHGGGGIPRYELIFGGGEGTEGSSEKERRRLPCGWVRFKAAVLVMLRPIVMVGGLRSLSLSGPGLRYFSLSFSKSGVDCSICLSVFSTLIRWNVLMFVWLWCPAALIFLKYSIIHINSAILKLGELWW